MLRTWRRPQQRRRHAAPRPRARLHLDELEDRTLLAVYTPAQIVTAYGFNQINLGTSSSPIPGNGRGQTIAIVDAYSDPHITTDLAHFDSQFGLPKLDGVNGDGAFTQIDLSHGTPDPTGGNWELETALDVEWAHAIAPLASIVLVEAANDSQAADGSPTALLAAVDAAANSGASVVSMSWGVSEFAGEAKYDSHFQHPGVTFVAASGDGGALGAPIWPAASPDVLSVGGTLLRLTSSAGAYGGEAGWGYGSWSWFFGGSGGGVSQFEPKPGYQSGVTQSATRRTNPDVAFDAGPDTGVYVYDNGFWYGVGGTSLGAPSWAALVAIADQGAARQGHGPLSGATQTLPAIYSAAPSAFHDITRGNNGSPAGPGYDLVTGRGTPVAPAVVRALVAAADPPAAPAVSTPPSDLTKATPAALTPTPKTPPPLPTGSAKPKDITGTGPTTGASTTTTPPLPTTVTTAAPAAPGAAPAPSTATNVILPAPAAFASLAALPTASTVTAVTTAAPAATFAATVTGLTPQPAAATANSGGGAGGDTLGPPAFGTPGAPVEGNPVVPAGGDRPAPTPAVPEAGAPALPDAAPGVPAGDADEADGGAAFSWGDGEYATLPNSGAAVAALLLALGYRGTGRPRRPEEDARCAWLAR
jgi:hypothetical protein